LAIRATTLLLPELLYRFVEVKGENTVIDYLTAKSTYYLYFVLEDSGTSDELKA